MNDAEKKKLRLLEGSVQLRRIGKRAVRKAREENRRLGIPNAFSRNGKIYYELPSGEIVEDDPAVKKTDPLITH